jgi:hypothetical protein
MKKLFLVIFIGIITVCIFILSIVNVNGSLKYSEIESVVRIYNEWPSFEEIVKEKKAIKSGIAGKPQKFTLEKDGIKYNYFYPVSGNMFFMNCYNSNKKICVSIDKDNNFAHAVIGSDYGYDKYIFNGDLRAIYESGKIFLTIRKDGVVGAYTLADTYLELFYKLIGVVNFKDPALLNVWDKSGNKLKHKDFYSFSAESLDKNQVLFKRKNFTCRNIEEYLTAVLKELNTNDRKILLIKLFEEENKNIDVELVQADCNEILKDIKIRFSDYIVKQDGDLLLICRKDLLKEVSVILDLPLFSATEKIKINSKEHNARFLPENRIIHYRSVNLTELLDILCESEELASKNVKIKATMQLFRKIDMPMKTFLRSQKYDLSRMNFPLTLGKTVRQIGYQYGCPRIIVIKKGITESPAYELFVNEY